MQKKIWDLGFSWLNIFNGRVTRYFLNNCLNNPFFFHFSVVNKFKSYITLYKNLNNLNKYDLNFKD